MWRKRTQRKPIDDALETQREGAEVVELADGNLHAQAVAKAVAVGARHGAAAEACARRSDRKARTASRRTQAIPPPQSSEDCALDHAHVKRPQLERGDANPRRWPAGSVCAAEDVRDGDSAQAAEQPPTIAVEGRDDRARRSTDQREALGGKR